MTAGSSEAAISRDMIQANKRVCVGSGMCVGIAPGAFELGDDLKVHVRDPLGEADLDDLLDAEESCPVSAITILTNANQEN